MTEDLGSAGMSSLLMQAAQAAAQADGVLDASSQAALQQARNAMAIASVQRQQQEQQLKAAAGNGKKKGPPLRRGKWTPEEEAYAARLIHEFKAGLLPLTDGTTLRTFLSKLLNCDPMRISKKFVGSNCIGKQVFRRRTADLNRLTPEQIQQSRLELSDLERRFLERVAQTNRVKNSGCGAAPALPPVPHRPVKREVGERFPPPTVHPMADPTSAAAVHPPWLQPPLGYRHGNGQAFAASHLSGANARAAAAGRALLGSLTDNASSSSAGGGAKFSNATTEQLANAARHGGSTGILALAELQRRASQTTLLQSALQQQQQQQQQNNANNILQHHNDNSNTALQQLARNASAHHFASQLGNADTSMNSLMLKTGLSRDQLSQLARDRGLASSGSLNNLMNRQKSFDALMSLDFQSLQSIDNLANLIQTGGMSGGGLNMPISGMKNADFGAMLSAASSRNNLNASSSPGTSIHATSEQDFSDAAQRLANANSANRMDALLRNLSNNNVPSSGGGDTSNAALSNLLQSMQSNLHQLNGQGGSASASSLFNQHGMDGNNNNSASQSALNLARLLRPESSTGLSALRMQDGLSQRNSSSVDDFLSLVAAGDIPHQDPSLLNVPLMQQQDAAAKLLAQQQLLQASGSTSNFGNSLTSGQSFNSMRNGTNHNMDSIGGSSSQLSDSTSALALAMAQVRAAAMQNGNGKRPSDLISGMISDKDNVKR